MTLWAQRPTEEANLLNPAFNGWLTANAAAGYSEEAHEGMPFALAFLVQPVVLHRPTREALPRDTRTSLHAWLEEQPAHRLEFAERARAFVPVVREGVLFALVHGGLDLGADGALTVRTIAGPADRPEAGTDFAACVARARFVGRWFARAGSATTIFAAWGVHP